MRVNHLRERFDVLGLGKGADAGLPERIIYVLAS